MAKVISADTFKNFGDNCAICGKIPSNIKYDKIQNVFSKFGEIQCLLLEDENGKEVRQALVFYSTRDGLLNATKRENAWQLQSISGVVEKCSQKMKDLGYMHSLLLLEKQLSEQKKIAKQFLSEGFIQKLGKMLEQINQESEDKEHYDTQMNSLLISKFICDILVSITNILPQSMEVVKQANIPMHLLRFVSIFPKNLINQQHSHALAELSPKFGLMINIQMQIKLGGLQILCNLLKHPNKKVKLDIITTMKNILDINDTWRMKRRAHSLYWNLKADKTIVNICKACLDNEDDKVIRITGAIVLGILEKEQCIEKCLEEAGKRKLIEGLKLGVSLDKKNKNNVQCLDVLCGVALKQCAIPDIYSNNFTYTLIQIAKHHSGDAKTYSLELLLTMAENGYMREVKNFIGEFGLLVLIGEKNDILNNRALDQTKSWSNNEKLKIMSRFIFNKKINDKKQRKLQGLESESDEDDDDDEFDDEEESDEDYEQNKSKTELQNQQAERDIMLRIGYSHLNLEIKQLKENKKTGNEVQPLNLGMISCICDFLAKSVIKFNRSDSKTNLPKENELVQVMLNVLDNLPIIQANKTHLMPLCNLLTSKQSKQSPFNHKPYTISVIQCISKYLVHPSPVVIKTISYALFCFFSSVKNVEKFHMNYEEQISQFAQHPFYEELNLDGTVETIGKSLVEYKDNEDISQDLCVAYCSLCRGNEVPSDVLRPIIFSVKRRIELCLYSKLNINQEIAVLSFISQCKNSHNILLKDEMLQTLFSYFERGSMNDKLSIIQLLCILYERAETNTRKSIKEQFPIERVQKCIKKNKMTNKYLHTQDSDKYDNYYMNVKCFLLIGWYNQEILVDQVAQLRSEIIKCSKKKKPKEIKDVKDIINNNQIWHKLNEIIKLVIQIKDHDTIEGVMSIVQEGIAYFLYEVAMRWDYKEISETIISLQQLVNEINDEILNNLIHINIYGWMQYLIDPPSPKEQYINNIEKVVCLDAQLAERGALMSKDLDMNHFSYFSLETNIIKLMKILDRNKSRVKNPKRIAEISETIERIKFNKAIQIGFSSKDSYLQQKDVQFCAPIFKLKLSLFILLQNLRSLQPQLQQSENQSQAESDEIQRVILSVGYMAVENQNANELVNKHLMVEALIHFIHLRCKCSLSIPLDKSLSEQGIVSASFYALSKLLENLNEQKIDEISNKHNILNHIIPIIMSEQPINGSSLNLLSNGMNLLKSLINSSRQITQKVINEPNLVDKIITLSSGKLFADTSSIQSLNAHYRSLELIQSLLMNGSVQYSMKILYQKNAMKILSHQMSCSGGSSHFDEIISASIECLSVLFQCQMKNQNQKDKLKQIQNELKERIEQEGLIEEDNNLFFHSDSRIQIGVITLAKRLKIDLK
ncbi:MAG: hypothetical protein EZS28_010112 [Streblomastix strix]|uniref:RRM domain-containing protein n=1 Tax=Streblomastix strix TaxID=222440 RepID=A0A5J4WIJ4_9EUKA|nr:MAG: hypothetical protein EZS28_010112 [Streblomastix strix]